MFCILLVFWVFFLSMSNNNQQPLFLGQAALKLQFKSSLFSLNAILSFLNDPQILNFFFSFCRKEEHELLHLTLPKSTSNMDR